MENMFDDSLYEEELNKKKDREEQLNRYNDNDDYISNVNISSNGDFVLGAGVNSGSAIYAKNRGRYAMASFICGLLSVTLLSYFGFILGTAGIICYKHSCKLREGKKDFARLGLWLSIVGIPVGITMIVLRPTPQDIVELFQFWANKIQMITSPK